MKDPENKQRISIYVDRELVKKADELLSLVYADMMVRLVASCLEVEPGELDEIQRQAYNNVRRTRGKISLEETLRHTKIKEVKDDN